MTIDELFEKIESLQLELTELMMEIDDNRRYSVVSRYIDKIEARIVTDCVAEYIRERLEDGKIHNADR